MALTIHKYPFRTEDRVTIDMPEGAVILTLQTQFDTPCLWALVNSSAPLTPRTFRLISTGLELTSDFKGKFIGTYQLSMGLRVWHVFEI